MVCHWLFQTTMCVLWYSYIDKQIDMRVCCACAAIFLCALTPPSSSSSADPLSQTNAVKLYLLVPFLEILSQSSLPSSPPRSCLFPPARKSFQSLDQLSTDMSLSQTSAGPRWPLKGRPTHRLNDWLTHQFGHPGGSPPWRHVCCAPQVKRRLRLWRACVAPWPRSPATSLWPASSPAIV